MSENPAGYYTDADIIRETLRVHGPLTRSELCLHSDLDRSALAKSLYQLKKKGDVMEEGDKILLTKAPMSTQDATKAPEDAQDAREAPDLSSPTTNLHECTTARINTVGQDSHNESGSAETVDRREWPGSWESISNALAVLTETVRLARDHAERDMAEYASLVADSQALHDLREKLKEIAR